MCKLFTGAPVASALNEQTKRHAAQLMEKGITPTLAILRVGRCEDDLAYERSAMKRCAAVGVGTQSIVFEADVSQREMLSAIDGLNADPLVHGVLLLRPLPKQLNESVVCERLSPAKDVDGITTLSLGGVFTGQSVGFSPCTAGACLEMLDHYGVALEGKRVVVVGRSLVIGKPVAMMLLGRHATVTICHTRTANLQETCKAADIIIVAAGKMGVLDESFFSPHQIVIDVGIHVAEDGSLCGDVRYDKEHPPVAGITPVPGGVGAVTTSLLARNVTMAALLAYRA